MAAIPKGAENLFKWVLKRLKKELNKARNIACGKIDSVIAQLRAKGAKVPKMTGWSCDQKIAFVAALGPYGIATVVAGALVGQLATNTAHEVARNIDRATDAVKDISKRLGLKIPDVKLPSVSIPNPFRGISGGSMDVEAGFLGRSGGQFGNFGNLGDSIKRR